MKIKNALEILRLRAEKNPDLKEGYEKEKANLEREKRIIAELSSIESAIKIFEMYDFRDKYGHKLTMCSHFLTLLDMAIP